MRPTATGFAACALVLTLAGCSPVPPPPPPEPVARADLPQQRIFFTQRPEFVLNAMRDMCQSPDTELVRSDADGLECRFLIEPRITAALILAYDGTIDDLPRAVLQASIAPDSDGHVLTLTPYAQIPRRRDTPALLPLDSPRFLRAITRSMTRLGGQVLPPE